MKEIHVPQCSLQHYLQYLGHGSREGNGTPLQYSCLENPMDRGAWWAAVHGVAKSRTRLSDLAAAAAAAAGHGSNLDVHQKMNG